MILIHFLPSGDYDDDIDFTYDFYTEVYGSCSASLNDKMFVFGGMEGKRQVYIKRILHFLSAPLNRIR